MTLTVNGLMEMLFDGRIKSWLIKNFTKDDVIVVFTGVANAMKDKPIQNTKTIHVSSKQL